MDLQFLGTSAGVPTKARNVTGTAVIEATGSHWYLVDCGEATQHQLLHTSLSIRDLRGVFITHVHGDHCFGLPGLLASAGMSGRTEPLDLITPAALHDWIRLSLAVSQTFLTFELRLLAVEALGTWHNDNIQVSTVALSHRVPSHGFVFTEINPEPRLDIQRLDAEGIPRGPLWGELAHGNPVVHDGRRLNPRITCARPALPGASSSVATTTPQACSPRWQGRGCAGARGDLHPTADRAHPGHLRPQHGRGGGAVRRTGGVKNLVLTHFSARYQPNPSAARPSQTCIRKPWHTTAAT